MHVHLGVPLTYLRCTKGRVSTVLQPGVVRAFALPRVNECRVSGARAVHNRASPRRKDRFGGTRGIQAHNMVARTVSAPAPLGAGVDRPALAPQSRRPTGIPTGRGGGTTPPLARSTGVPAALPRLQHTGCYTGQDRCAHRLNPPPLLQRPRPHHSRSQGTPNDLVCRHRIFSLRFLRGAWFRTSALLCPLFVEFILLGDLIRTTLRVTHFLTLTC